ncbi:OmpA family protein [Epibacterium ulvae]|uniref:OmpA family protein n=1 Tax=Epibacterium ulvae TaxID=1156985 RepID=UPI0024924D54|nr:OmpA family protein [Epibacterium ulvae]
MLKRSLLLCLTMAAGACTNEAGLERQSVFGEATRHNAAVTSGDLNFVVQLGQRFANEVPTTINFDFNSARLDSQAKAVLDRQADWIKQFPEVRFKVFGHTDAVGSDAYNRRLGKRRATTSVNYLISKGISRKRLEAVVSLGETKPVIASPNRERENRRTVTEVSGFVRDNPLLDGKYAAIVYRDYVQSAVVEGTLTLDDGLETKLSGE